MLQILKKMIENARECCPSQDRAGLGRDGRDAGARVNGRDRVPPLRGARGSLQPAAECRRGTGARQGCATFFFNTFNFQNS